MICQTRAALRIASSSAPLLPPPKSQFRAMSVLRLMARHYSSVSALATPIAAETSTIARVRTSGTAMFDVSPSPSPPVSPFLPQTPTMHAEAICIPCAARRGSAHRLSWQAHWAPRLISRRWARLTRPQRQQQQPRPLRVPAVPRRSRPPRRGTPQLEQRPVRPLPPPGRRPALPDRPVRLSAQPAPSAMGGPQYRRSPGRWDWQVGLLQHITHQYMAHAANSLPLGLQAT